MRFKLFHLLVAISVFFGCVLLVQSQQITNTNGFYAGKTSNTFNDFTNRNVLINGSMAVQQYDAAILYGAGTATFTNVDRWNVLPAGAGITSAVQGANDRTGKRSLKALTITGNTSVTTVDLYQRIRAANMTALLGSITISAQVYNNTGGAVVPVMMVGTPGAADNFTTTTIINGSGSGENLQSCANLAWTKISWTADISGYSNVTNGLQVQFRFPSGSLDANTKYVKVSEVQCEAGSVATAFEVLPYEVELNRCCDYVRVWKQDGSASGLFVGHGAVFSATSGRIFISLGKPLYATPSLYCSATAANFIVKNDTIYASSSLPTLAAGPSSGNVVLITTTAGTMTANDSVLFYIDASTSGWIMLRAEP